MSIPIDVPGFLSVLMERAPAGFALGLHARFQTPTFMFQTYPVAWLEEYSREGLVMHDPTIAWAGANRGVVSWEELKDQDPAGVFERARRHGMTHGFAISLERGGSLSLGSFARGDRAFTPEEISAIQETVIALHDGTDGSGTLSAATREALRRLSVAFTQP